MTQNEGQENGLHNLLELKDEILEVLNQLKETSERLQRGETVHDQEVKALLTRGTTLAQKIGDLPGMEQAGKDFLDHIHKISQAMKDLRNFDALKKENLIAEVRF
jgi:hypothetical protein